MINFVRNCNLFLNYVKLQNYILLETEEVLSILVYFNLLTFILLNSAVYFIEFIRYKSFFTFYWRKNSPFFGSGLVLEDIGGRITISLTIFYILKCDLCLVLLFLFFVYKTSEPVFLQKKLSL